MKLQQIALLPGDGIGPEVVAQAVKVLKAASDRYNLNLTFKEGLIGAIAIDKTGDPFPAETEALCEASDAILLGAVGDPKFDNDPNAKVRPEQGLLRMRKNLGLFANVRPTVMYKELADFSPLRKERLEGVDLVIYRELTSGVYFGEKSTAADGQSAQDVCYYAISEIERVAHLAFKAAQKRRKKLCLVDKANVLDTSRLWRKTVQKMSAEYPDVEVSYMFVDNAAMQMIVWPAQFDVLLTSNMFGDIISDEASVLSGSMGLLPSASVGNENVLFEPIHGSYPQAAGKDIANPMATILSAAMLLRQFDLDEAATAIEQAVETCIQQGFVTQDLNKENYMGTNAVGSKVASLI
ncbi:MAG: 3-isopropylmalate dehydrogenase [Bacteroidota bacterium]